MNLVDGKILETAECDAVLNTLDERILATLAKPRLNPGDVIDACDRLVGALDEDYYLAAMAELGIHEALGRSYLLEARRMFSGDALRHRMAREFGAWSGETQAYTPIFGTWEVSEWLLPLGVLLHIAAGNADGLPAFSVLEGLLTGNINILKLPAAEGGISVRLLLELIKIRPALAEYIYVFDYSSKDIIHINKLIGAADAVVVWGGAEAVTALRQTAPPNVRLIEWGHKLSFAYAAADGWDDADLEGLAANIAETGQLLCSSCQGVYVDTSERAELMRFAQRFLPVLERAVDEKARLLDAGVRCQTALELYTSELETVFTGNQILRGQGCSVTVCGDAALEPSIRFANPWVKPLPRADLLRTLRPYKNYLQTAGLLCGERERGELAELLLRTGVVRVCPGGRMSGAYAGAAHDGEFPLRRYVKVAAAE